MIVLKLRAARERKKARTGRCEGRKPYGHYPGEKRTIERMAALRREGLGFLIVWRPNSHLRASERARGLPGVARA